MTAPHATISSNALPDDVEVAAFRGEEALSEPYRYAVGILGRDPLDLDEVIGARATLTVEAVSAPVVVHGIVASVEHLHQIGERALHQLVITPRLYGLSQSLHSQVYIDKSDVQIVDQVLRAGGLGDDDLRFDLTGAYPTERHVCQYHESDLSFVSRLLERQGIHYFFEQLDGHERLVLCDHASGHRPLVEQALRYVPGAADDAIRAEALCSFRCRAQIVPGSVCLRDYDYQKPALDVTGRAAISQSFGEINVHGENFGTPDEGRRLAAIRAEEISCRRKLFHGHGRVPLRTGYTFTLSDHPVSALCSDYLVIRLELRGHCAAASPEVRALLGGELGMDEPYRADLVAIGASEPFRPERKTPKPRIYGVENGVIDGPADSPYAQIDAEGRYKVKIDFDEADESGGRASTWVRMLQPHGGTGEGFHFPLRKGTEVLLTFLGGDPDRPVISGVLPNALTPSPVLADNHTQNVLQSGGHNRLEMEDLAGQQRTTLSTPTEASYLSMGAQHNGSRYNVDLSTAGDSRIYSGREMDVVVDSHHTETVAGNVMLKHQKNQSTHVEDNKTLTVNGDDIQDVGGIQTIDVDGVASKTYHSDYNKQVDGTYTKVVGTDRYRESIENSGDVRVTTSGEIRIRADGEYHINTNGKDIQLDNDKGYIRITEGGAIELSCSTLDVKQKSTEDLSSEFRQGAKTSTFIGAVQDNFIGIKNENTLAGTVETNIGLSATFDLGGRLEYVHLPKFAVCALKNDTKKLWVRNNKIEVSDSLTRVDKVAIRIWRGPTISK